MIKPRLVDFPEYYRRYIEKVITKDIIPYLTEQKDLTAEFFRKIGEEKSKYRYAEGKWSIKQILGHICDSERIFVARSLKFARSEKQNLPGFEQDDYVDAANFDDLPLDLLISDFVKMRESHLSLYSTFNTEIYSRKGMANDTEFSVASTLYVIAGHVDHHIKVIKERYF